MCFVHVVLNALDLHEKGNEVQVVIEGSATALVPKLAADDSLPAAPLYAKCRELGLIAGVCQACAHKTGSLDAAKEQGLALLADMKGHPSMAGFLDRGYQVYTF